MHGHHNYLVVLFIYLFIFLDHNFLERNKRHLASGKAGTQPLEPASSPFCYDYFGDGGVYQTVCSDCP
jgi:hypothetical protein